MESREFQGRTVDEALESAALKLSLAKDSIDYTVIDEGSRGFLNIIGSKPAKIMVKLKRDSIKEAKRFLYDIFENMGISATIETEETDENQRKRQRHDQRICHTENEAEEKERHHQKRNQNHKGCF